MQKNTTEVQGYFERHPGVNELFFVKGLPFFTQSSASNQAKNIQKADNEQWPVIRVTRDEAFAQVAADAPAGEADEPTAGQEQPSGTEAAESAETPAAPARKGRGKAASKQ